MLIEFSVANFLSFFSPVTLSMRAGKIRKKSERIFNEKNCKLIKCKTIMGANASGKSNLIHAFSFFQKCILQGIPTGYSQRYFRLQTEPYPSTISSFSISFVINKKTFTYALDVDLAKGSLVKESLEDTSLADNHKLIFFRNLANETFTLGKYFKDKESVFKLTTYGNDSLEILDFPFLSIINRGMSKIYKDNTELVVLKQIYQWFAYKLVIRSAKDLLIGRPYFNYADLDQVAKILRELGTGIVTIKKEELPIERMKDTLPDETYEDIIKQLEKCNRSAKQKEIYKTPTLLVGGYKAYFELSIDINDKITAKTLKFGHDTPGVYFNFSEESDGTVRLMDIVDILFRSSEGCTYIFDEIDRCLHPALTTNIIAKYLENFQVSDQQLIFTSHESRLLDSELLRNDEIDFMIKCDNGESASICVDNLKFRADKKVYAALFDGTLDNKIKEYLDKLK